MVTALLALPLSCTYDYHRPVPTERDVQMLGDSLFDLTGDIHAVLEDLSGERYLDRSVAGATLQGVSNQLETALERRTVRTILATGGANDLVVDGRSGSERCRELSEPCLELIDELSATLDEMISMMRNGPSDHHVWVGPYRLTGDNADFNPAIDYVHDVAYPVLFDLTDEGGTFYEGEVPGFGRYFGTRIDAFHLHVLDPREAIRPEDLWSDDLHPRPSASEKLAELIWGSLVNEDLYR